MTQEEYQKQAIDRAVKEFERMINRHFLDQAIHAVMKIDIQKVGTNKEVSNKDKMALYRRVRKASKVLKDYADEYTYMNGCEESAECGW